MYYDWSNIICQLGPLVTLPRCEQQDTGNGGGEGRLLQLIAAGLALAGGPNLPWQKDPVQPARIRPDFYFKFFRIH